MWNNFLEPFWQSDGGLSTPCLDWLRLKNKKPEGHWRDLVIPRYSSSKICPKFDSTLNFSWNLNLIEKIKFLNNYLKHTFLFSSNVKDGFKLPFATIFFPWLSQNNFKIINYIKNLKFKLIMLEIIFSSIEIIEILFLCVAI